MKYILKSLGGRGLRQARLSDTGMKNIHYICSDICVNLLFSVGKYSSEKNVFKTLGE